jgi:hypothetical protein
LLLRFATLISVVLRLERKQLIIDRAVALRARPPKIPAFQHITAATGTPTMSFLKHVSLARSIPAIVLGAAMLLGSAAFTGCATITRGTTEQLTVVSDPSGASVRLSNGFTGITPATFTLPRKGNVIVTVSKEGYDSIDVPVSASLSGAGTAGFVGNALIGGIIGGGVDIATGATLSHTPNPVSVTLRRKPIASSPAPAPEKAPESVGASEP